MEGGFFTTALALLRAAWGLIKRVVNVFTSLGGGLAAEIIALVIIWAIVLFAIPIIEKAIDIFHKLLDFWE